MNDVYKLSQDRVQDLMKRQDEFLKKYSGGMLTWSSKYLLPEIHKNDIFFPCVQIENLDLSLDNLKDCFDVLEQDVKKLVQNGESQICQ